MGRVTPCVGVWIEIDMRGDESVASKSLPAWECGLKCNYTPYIIPPNKSLPAWECGLKSSGLYVFSLSPMSLPAWECGLKFWVKGHDKNRHNVTPCVGVWIEIRFEISARTSV